MTYQEAIQAYVEKFDEGPPIREMEEQEAIRAIEAALESGKPMESSPIEDELPEGAFH